MLELPCFLWIKLLNFLTVLKKWYKESLAIFRKEEESHSTSVESISREKVRNRRRKLWLQFNIQVRNRSEKSQTVLNLNWFELFRSAIDTIQELFEVNCIIASAKWFGLLFERSQSKVDYVININNKNVTWILCASVAITMAERQKHVLLNVPRTCPSA